MLSRSKLARFSVMNLILLTLIFFAREVKEVKKVKEVKQYDMRRLLK